MSIIDQCPSCGFKDISIFYELRQVPVHSVLLLPTRDEALNYPKGDIVLGFCSRCGFISNLAFDPSLHEYSARYEETQGFSATFNTFHRRLALQLIEKYDLHEKNIIEIGCGKGEFLTLLCELGNNRGVGIDPAYISDRNQSQAKERITFIKDFYSEKHATHQGDFVCCKMTLEHIQHTADFVTTVRRAVGDQPNTIIFFQVPNVIRILQDMAFWDIYYEHCSYFSPGSLARLFQHCGFDVINLAQDYDDQYLMIEARPGSGQIRTAALNEAEDLKALQAGIAYFSEKYQQKLAVWQNELAAMKKNKQRVVIWGAGSKGVSFLTTLNIQAEIEYAVDVNPYKHGTYMAGTGQKIVAPEFLRTYQPDTVIVMNPIYCQEIQQDLDKLGVTAKLIPV